MTTLPLLTNSRMSTAKQCLRKCYYRYELGLVRDREAPPLRFGSACHLGRELIRKGVPVDEAIDQATAGYATRPQYEDPEDWDVEHWTVRAMLTGWAWRWGNDDTKHVETEVSFELPLVNPETGMPSRTWSLAGKIDGIDQLADTRLVVSEFKTTSEDITPESAYWIRLRADQQIGLYVLCARKQHPVSAVVYDVVRKPTIRPRQIPTLDDVGLKIVKDDVTGERVMNGNGKPRQTAGEGMTLLARTENGEEFATRLVEDFQARPDFYFQRVELPVLEADLAELQYEIWQQGLRLRDCQLTGRWFKTVSRFTCNWCDYSGICLTHIQADKDHIPAGYKITEDVNPELAE